MNGMGRLLILAGLALVAGGLLFSFAPKTLSWLGKLPGDITVKRGNSGFYFPVTTCLVISAVVSFIMWLLKK